jgi:hypothetical protein
MATALPMMVSGRFVIGTNSEESMMYSGDTRSNEA